MKIFKQFFHFSLVSGIGWLLDICIFLSLVYFSPFIPLFSNIISSFVAITYVYFISIRKIFVSQTNDKLVGFFVYIIYQIISILSFSFLIQFINNLLVNLPFELIDSSELASKIIVTPFTLLTNYFFMKLLLERILVKQTNQH